MAHQCLECGEAYEEGSPELLKGCAECGGTRFFFTQSPVSDEDRHEIKAQAEEDLKAIVQDMVDEGVKPDYDDDIWSSDKRSEWLAVDPDTAGQTVKEYVEEMAEGEDVEPDEDVVEGLEELVEESDQGVMDSLEVDVVEDDAGDETETVELEQFVDPDPKAVAEAESEEDTAEDEDDVEDVAPPTVPAGEAETAEPEPVPDDMWEAEDDEADDEESRPEVVTVHQPGEYEIDVERLMGDSPIIVQNDGSYLVHLPSVFRSDRLK